MANDGGNEIEWNGTDEQTDFLINLPTEEEGGLSNTNTDLGLDPDEEDKE